MQKSVFFRLFPPPKIIKMPAVGLDISDESIHFVELKEVKDGFVISNFGRRDIPRDVIKSGKINNGRELVKILASVKDEISSTFVNVSLPEQSAYLFKLRIPKMKTSEIRGNIDIRLEDNVPISARDAVFDYDVIRWGDKKDPTTDAEISVLPRIVVENYLTVLGDAGLTPLLLEIEAQAIARSVIPKGDDGTFMIMDFGKTRTGLSIVSNGITRFTSTVDIGGFALTMAIEKALKVKPEEAERLKRENGVVKRDENEELFLTMMSIIGVLREEISKHYIYWHTHEDQYGRKRPKIEKIFLCGGDANLEGLTGYLSAGLGVGVELSNVMVNVNSFEKYIPKINFNDSLHYATAIGLALNSQ